MTERGGDEAPDPVFDALWAKALESWDDDRVHLALLEHGLRGHGLPELAGRYRSLSTDPAKAERANKKLDAVVAAATQMLWATKTERAPKVPWQITLTVALICALLLSWLALAFWGHS